MKTPPKSSCSDPRRIAAALAGALLAALALPTPAAAGSLWQDAGPAARSLVADPKAARPGDILTVIISETVVTRNTQSTKNSKQTSTEAAVTQFLFPPTASRFGTHGGALPSTGFAGSNSFAADGAVANNQSAVGRTAVLVVDALPNGTLAVKGVRKVTFGGQSQYVVLTGLVRAEDISPANTVSSSSIAEASLEFIDEGALTDAQKKGWLTRVWDLLRPY